jgi:hypothetical protein
MSKKVKAPKKEKIAKVTKVTKAKKTIAQDEPGSLVAGSANLQAIEGFLEKQLKWTDRVRAKEVASNEALDLTLPQFLSKSLEASVNQEDEAYAEALKARSADDKHTAIVKIIEARQRALTDTTEDEAAVEETQYLDDAGAEPDALKTPRKKGWLERTFDELCVQYQADPSDDVRDSLLGLIAQMETNRRVRFFYDLQQLRIGASNRSSTYAREFGVKDSFIDYAGTQLERLERHSEKMVDRILARSPDGEFYAYLIETYLGVGTMMAGCMISEISAPERFRTVSCLWKYAGLAVVNNDPATGRGGHSQRRMKGEAAAWNHFLRTKLLGVLASCMIKAQTRHIGTPEESTKGRNVKVLNDYKNRLATQNDLVPASQRVYNAKGKEIFTYQTNKPIQVYSETKQGLGEVRPCDIKRRSKAHINKMATRYMIKMFLVEILNKWRNLKGYESLPTYDEAKLRGGIPHGGFNNRPLPVPAGRNLPQPNQHA